jgi:hypothetical protein
MISKAPVHLLLVHVAGVRLCLWTAATSESDVHPLRVSSTNLCPSNETTNLLWISYKCGTFPLNILLLFSTIMQILSRVALSVSCLATDWTTGRSRFDSRQRRKDFSSSLCVQTGSGAHPVFCTLVSRVLSPGLKRGRGVTLTTHPHLVPRSRMSRGYTSPPSASVARSGTALAFIMQITALTVAEKLYSKDIVL